MKFERFEIKLKEATLIWPFHVSHVTDYIRYQTSKSRLSVINTIAIEFTQA